MCLTTDQYKMIKQVKNSNAFTCDQSVSKYMEGVKDRMSKWYGISEDTISTELILYFLSSQKPEEWEPKLSPPN